MGVPALSELAFFDVYPENGNASFEGDGTWSNYPYFDQKRVVAVSSMDLGGSSSSPVSAPWAAADTDDQDAARGALLTDGSSMAIAVRTTTRGCMR